MRIRYLPLVLLFSLIIPALCVAESSKVVPREVAGLEWLQMSAGDRLDNILTSMYILTQHGVALSKSPNDYVNAVGERLRLNPNLYSANVTNVLASIVYETEPGSGEALDKLRKKPEVKKIDMH